MKTLPMWSRRRFLEIASGLPLVGGLVGADASAAIAAPPGGARDYFRELGVRPFINAAGTYTAMTASPMPPQVIDATTYASQPSLMLARPPHPLAARIPPLSR